jgi:hypothetical protein
MFTSVPSSTRPAKTERSREHTAQSLLCGKVDCLNFASEIPQNRLYEIFWLSRKQNTVPEASEKGYNFISLCRSYLVDPHVY